MLSSTQTPVTVAVVGTFDGVHRGHVSLLRQAREWADRLGAGAGCAPARVVAVTFDRHPLAVIAPARCPAMLTPTLVRDELLRSDGGVDAVVSMAFTPQLCRLTAANFLRKLRHDYGVTHLLMGYDHNFGSDRPPREAGGEVVTAHYDAAAQQAGIEAVKRGDCLDLQLGDGRYVTVSSTVIRRLLGDGNVADAATLLGRPYCVSAPVVHGRHLGSTIGFPTANLAVGNSCGASAEVVLPLPGVYAAVVAGPGFADAPAVVNVGRCPTVVCSGPQTVEVHIPGLNRDLYGYTLNVAFTRRLRDERRFAGIEALRVQLAADVAELYR